MPRPRRRNPSPLVLAGGASALLAVAVGAWLLAKKRAGEQAQQEQADYRKQRFVGSLQNVASMGVKQAAASTLQPFRADDTSTSTSTDTSGVRGLRF